MFLKHAKKRAQPSGNIAATSQELQRVLAIRWWHWRKYFLEAKRLQVQLRRQGM